MKTKNKIGLIHTVALLAVMLVANICVNAQNDPTTTGSTAQTTTSSTKKITRSNHRKRRQSTRRSTRTSTQAAQSATVETTSDATSVPKATQEGNKLNQQGEVGAQAKDNARETSSGRRTSRQKKYIPTPAPPMKAGQPSEQAGEVAPTPAPAKPVKP
jgi:cytoskeletal protein RodZ